MFLRRFTTRWSFVLATFCAGLAAGRAHPSAIYTFEDLTVGANLVGQDNWQQYATQPNANLKVVQPTAGINTTSVVSMDASGSSGNQLALRPNDASFTFPAHSASDTFATMQIDLKYMHRDSPDLYAYYFGLGAPSSLSANPSKVSELNERAPGFGVVDRKFVVQRVAGSVQQLISVPASNLEVDHEDWVRLKFVLNLTANAGDGAGSLWMQNLTKQDTDFTWVGTADNLYLKSMFADVQNPATWNTMVLVKSSWAVAGQMDNLTANAPRGPATVYTFEGLTNGSLTNQDGWATYLGNSAFNVTGGLSGNASKVAEGSASPSFSVRPNDATWAFAPHSSPMTAMQFDLRFMPGTDAGRINSGVYFGLAADVDSTEGINTLNERGPAFGILQSQFGIQHLGSSANASFLGRPDDDFGVNAGDWLRMQLVIDTSGSADGFGTLYFMNLTQGDLGWTQINNTPVNMGLTSRYTGTYAAMQNPANWDTLMMVRAFTVGLQVDNLVPNAVPVPEPAAVVLAVFGLMGLGLVRRRR